MYVGIYWLTHWWRLQSPLICPPASRRAREASDVTLVQVQRPEDQESQCCKPQAMCGRRLMSQLNMQAERISLPLLLLPGPQWIANTRPHWGGQPTELTVSQVSLIWKITDTPRSNAWSGYPVAPSQVDIKSTITGPEQRMCQVEVFILL